MPRGYLYLLPELFFGAPGIHRLDPHLRKSIHLQLLGEGIDPLPKKPLCLSQPLPKSSSRRPRRYRGDRALSTTGLPIPFWPRYTDLGRGACGVSGVVPTDASR